MFYNMFNARNKTDIGKDKGMNWDTIVIIFVSTIIFFLWIYMIIIGCMLAYIIICAMNKIIQMFPQLWKKE